MDGTFRLTYLAMFLQIFNLKPFALPKGNSVTTDIIQCFSNTLHNLQHNIMIWYIIRECNLPLQKYAILFSPEFVFEQHWNERSILLWPCHFSSGCSLLSMRLWRQQQEWQLWCPALMWWPTSMSAASTGLCQTWFPLKMCLFSVFSHWLVNSFVVFGAPYMAFDIYAMYLTHFHTQKARGHISGHHSRQTIKAFLCKDWMLVLHHVALFFIFMPITLVRTTGKSHCIFFTTSWPIVSFCSSLGGDWVISLLAAYSSQSSALRSSPLGRFSSR